MTIVEEHDTSINTAAIHKRTQFKNRIISVAISVTKFQHVMYIVENEYVDLKIYNLKLTLVLTSPD